MKIKKIEKEYIKKLFLLKKYNQYYYDKSKPLVSDKIFKKVKSLFN